MSRHIMTGVAAVVDGASLSTERPESTVWVDEGDVVEALRQIRKLSDRTYPNVKAFTVKGNSLDEVALKLQ